MKKTGRTKGIVRLSRMGRKEGMLLSAAGVPDVNGRGVTE